MTFKTFKPLLALAAAAALGGAAQAQDIKFGYNGDLSASPSAQRCWSQWEPAVPLSRS